MSWFEHKGAARGAWIAVAAGLAALAGLLPGAGAATGPEVCAGVGAPTVAGVAPDAALNTTFTDYGNSGQGWTGADSTWSAPLPDGRELWLFSDTFLEPITPPTRPTSAVLVNNTFVRQSDDGLTTFYGGTSNSPAALIRPDTPGDWYWLGAGTVTGSTLQVPLTEWTKTGSGAFDIAWVRNALATFSTNKLKGPPTISALPSSAGIEWGSWVRNDGAYTYIYGVQDFGSAKVMHIARVAGTNLTGPWTYYIGGDPDLAASWSSNETASAPIMSGVANEYSVHRLTTGLYMLTTMDTTLPFSNQLDAYFSCTPTGPFVAKTTLYTTPETGQYGSYGNPNVYTYNAHVHPELSTSTRLVISYNVNSLDSTIGGDVYRDVSIYRPRFIDVSLGY